MDRTVFQDIFSKYDKENIGFIDRSELRDMFKESYKMKGKTLTEEELELKIKLFDASHNAKISEKEYCDVM